VITHIAPHHRNGYTFPNRLCLIAGTLLLTLLVNQPGWAQTVIIEQAEAQVIALQKGWIIRQESPAGVIELHSIVNGVPKYYMTHNADAADTVSTDECLPGGSSGLNLTGSGVTLGVWDAGGVRTTHQEFGGRATQMDSPGSTHYHSTHVAGTLIASGVVGAAKGMSPSASLDCWDWDNDESEMDSAAGAGLLVSSHSYGYVHGWYYDYYYYDWFWYGDVTVSTVEENWFGLYTSYTEDLDQIAFDNPHYLICKSAGNDRNDDGPGPGGGHYYYNPGSGYWEWSTTTRNTDGDWDCVGTKGSAKNILTVAAVYDVSGGYSGPGSVSMSSFSSWGPVDDGRIKPDIAANGIELYSTDDDSNSDYTTLSGTSMSSPNAAGSLGVLIQHWRSTHPGDMRSATLKGLVLHTANETGSANGPDYKYGWGLMNTLTAAEAISADVSESMTISEQTLNNGQTFEFSFAATGGSELRASICWTDPPGIPPGNLLDPPNKMLVNDLDLRIEKVSPSTTYYPWVLNPASPNSAATTGDNNSDNTEQVVVYSPGTNNYTVRVTHKGTLSGGSQNFSLFISGFETGPTTGACCESDGSCTDGVSEATCTGGGGTWQGAGSTCAGTVPTPTITADPGTEVCEGETVTLDAGAGFIAYVWSPGGETTRTIDVTTGGTYSVTVTDGSGCQGTDDIDITFYTNPAPTITADPGMEVCEGETVTLDAGAGFIAYVWSPGGETTRMIDVTTGGNYSVTVTDGSGCQGTDDIDITFYTNPTPTITADPGEEACEGTTVTLDAGGGYIAYLWSPGSETTQTIDVTTGGTYSVTVTDANGCQGTDDIDITFYTNPTPTITADPGTEVCEGETVTLDAGPGFIAYVWSPGGETTRTIDVTTGGNYSVTVTDGSGCQGGDDIDITVIEFLLGDVNGDGFINGLDIADYVRVTIDGDGTPRELCAADLEISDFITLLLSQ